VKIGQAILIAFIILTIVGCSSQNTNEAANNASRKVSDTANTVINKTREVAQNVNSSAGPTINDAAITTKIKAKLLADSITGTTVDTTNGVVTLTGAVANDEQKTKAARLAQETEGVKSVKNDLVIKNQ
jgi:hyperosmotically inducible protein